MSSLKGKPSTHTADGRLDQKVEGTGLLSRGAADATPAAAAAVVVAACTPPALVQSYSWSLCSLDGAHATVWSDHPTPPALAHPLEAELQTL